MNSTHQLGRVIPLSFVVAILVSLPSSADEALIQAGEQQAMVCKACHQFELDGVAVVGPPLWGIAQRDIASTEGFNYSDALKKLDGKWDANKLDAFLLAPNEYAPGTNMVFPGIKDPGARAAIIAWLATKNPTPANWVTESAGSAIKSVGDGILALGENMALVASVCSACHSLHLVAQQGLSKQRWDETLDWMVEEQGMDELNPDDREAVLVYLSTYYGM